MKISMRNKASSSSPMRPRRSPAAAVIFALATILPATAAADYDGQASGVVYSVRPSKDGRSVQFSLVGYRSLCGSSSSAYGWLEVDRNGVTREGIKDVLATLMAAKLSGANVTVWSYNSPTGFGCMVDVVELAQ